jgi:hypothetical protein
MKIVIHWQPELPGFRSSTRDENGLRILFGEVEANRILAALAASGGGPVTLAVNGPDAGYLSLETVDAEFRVLREPNRREGSRRSRSTT